MFFFESGSMKCRGSKMEPCVTSLTRGVKKEELSEEYWKRRYKQQVRAQAENCH